MVESIEEIRGIYENSTYNRFMGVKIETFEEGKVCY
jgi:hypothetical protein